MFNRDQARCTSSAGSCTLVRSPSSSSYENNGNYVQSVGYTGALSSGFMGDETKLGIVPALCISF